METKTTAAESLRTLREFAGMTQKEVADRAKTSPEWLSKIETGQRKASKSFIGRIADVIAQELSNAA